MTMWELLVVVALASDMLTYLWFVSLPFKTCSWLRYKPFSCRPCVLTWFALGCFGVLSLPGYHMVAEMVRWLACARLGLMLSDFAPWPLFDFDGPQEDIPGPEPDYHV